MKMLTCSKLSNFFLSASRQITRRFVLLFFVGCFSAHAQEPNQTQKQSESGKSPVWLQTSELPAQATESDSAKKKPGLVSSAVNWFRRTSLPGDLQIHGFAGQSYILTSDNDVFGNSDAGGSFGFTEAGLNASARLSPKLQLSSQMLSRRAGQGTSATPRLDYAVLDYRAYSHEMNQFGIRVGRLKNPFGFYNDTRDVPFTRPSIMLPQSIYFDRTRNFGLSGDSVQVYGENAISNWGTVSTQFGVLWPLVHNRDTEVAFLGKPQPGHLTREASYIGRSVFETNDKRIRLAVSGAWFNSSYDPAGKDDHLGPGSFQFTPIFFSAQYNTERWSLTSEYALRHSKFDKNFGTSSPLSGSNFYGESFYFQGEYRFTPKWETILRYDVFFADRADRDGSRFVEKGNAFIHSLGDPPGIQHPVAHSRFAKDITVGLRWNITPEFMLRAEYHRVDGTGWLSKLDNPVSKDTSEHWDLYAIQASYRF